MQETVESWPAAAHNRQAAARARYGSVVQRHVARQHLLAGYGGLASMFRCIRCPPDGWMCRWITDGGRFSTAVDSVLSRLAPARSRGGLPVMGGVTGAVGGQTIIPLASLLLPY